MQNWSSSMDNPEVVVNENFETLAHAACYGKNPATSNALTWGYFGGRWGGVSISAGTLTLADGATNYIVVNIDTSAISVSSSSTNWDNNTDYARVYKVVTSGGAISSTEDHRSGPYGIGGGGGGSGGSTSQTVKLVPAGSDYVFILSDEGKLLIFNDPDGWNVLIEQIFPAGWWVDVQNIGAAQYSVPPAYGSPSYLLDGSESAVNFSTGQGMRIVSDGLGGYYTNRGGAGTTDPTYRLVERIVVGDETTALTTGTAKFKWRNVLANYVDGVRASLNTAQGSGAQLVTIDIKVGGVSMFSTLLTFDNGETTTETATTPAVISDGNLADDVEMQIDVTVQGGSAAAGLKVYLLAFVQIA